MPTQIFASARIHTGNRMVSGAPLRRLFGWLAALKQASKALRGKFGAPGLDDGARPAAASPRRREVPGR